ncbi:MAG: prepilin-type N-terminal cleavage/methylation domain-containing protein [Eubacterium sp.]|nr:prepilin-type N-terminal cleavage/methylation domain-containing protein [Eubacterium sp.]
MKNKGFSLVELIIIISIMTIIAVAIAPALIRYINKSRKADDLTAADTIKSAYNAALANEDIYEVVAKKSEDTNMKLGSDSVTALLVASADDDEWTIYGSSSDDLKIFKEEMDKTCPPEKLKFRKNIDPSDSKNSNTDYLIGGTDEFTPDGWLVCMNQAEEPCVFVTNGKKNSDIHGVSLSPLKCSAYKE